MQLPFLLHQNIKLKLICLLIATLGFSGIHNHGYAQPERMSSNQSNATSGTLMGSIVDENGKAAEYATIYVKKTSDSTIAQTGITNEEGKFVINDISFGTIPDRVHLTELIISQNTIEWREVINASSKSYLSTHL